jgi:pimeloyl-ACP methyl ester carboxylesterase
MISKQPFVLVPGSHHGGWSFEPVTSMLRSHGHPVFPLTLTGVGDRNHLLSGTVNLSTHITDVVAALEAEQVTRAVLCGHSYGGMVITGVADRVPERVAALVYLDAFVPGDGDSAWSLTSDAERGRYLEAMRGDGFSVAPLPFFDARATSHPMASFLQEIRLTGAGAKVPRRVYVQAAAWDESPFGPTAERLATDPDWTVHTLQSGHNFMRDAPDDMLRILLAAADA